MKVKAIFIFLSFMLFAHVCQSNEEIIPFQPSDYDPKIFNITKCTYVHGNADITVTQVKQIVKQQRNMNLSPIFCRAWLEVKGTNGHNFCSYFSDIYPVGYSYGIFIPKVQPSSDYFVAIKFGDYDGKIFIVSKIGNVTELPGGEYFLTKDKRYLFIQYSSDLSMFLIFDFKQGKEIFRTEDIPYIHNWYFKDGYYMFTISEWTKGPIPCEKDRIVYIYDFQSNEIKEKKGDSVLIDAQKIEYDFEPGKITDCYCNE